MSIKIYVKYVKNNRDFHTTKLNLPTGALDSKSGKQVLELFESLNESGVTVVVITHDRNVAEQAKRIVHIIDGEITEEGQEAGNEKEKEN